MIHKIQKILKPTVLWEWNDIGFCFRIYPQLEFSEYHIGLDIQILWLEIWIQFFKKENHFKKIEKNNTIKWNAIDCESCINLITIDDSPCLKCDENYSMYKPCKLKKEE